MASMQKRDTASNSGGGTHGQKAKTFMAFLFFCATGWMMCLSSTNNSLRQVALDDRTLLPLKSTPAIQDSEVEASLVLQNRLIDRGVPPVTCSKVLKDARTKQTLDPNEGRLFARYTVDEPHFYISVHNQKYDNVRYDMFDKYGYYYERVLSNCFKEVLGENADGSTTTRQKRMLDVGGNIGWFALLAAAHGANVATFEPHPPNYLRMCESMCLNDWLIDHPADSSPSNKKNACLMGSYESPLLSKHITIFPYGVTEEAKDLFFMDNINPGQGHVMESAESKSAKPLRCVSLDDMVGVLGWTSGPIDILKVDVEGAEMGVFLGAQELLKSNRIQNVFIEGNVRDENEIAKFETLIKLFLDSGYYLYKMGGYAGPGKTEDVPNRDKDFTKNLVKKCGPNPSTLQCNLWWKPANGSAASATA